MPNEKLKDLRKREKDLITITSHYETNNPIFVNILDQNHTLEILNTSLKKYLTKFEELHNDISAKHADIVRLQGFIDIDSDDSAESTMLTLQTKMDNLNDSLRSLKQIEKDIDDTHNKIKIIKSKDYQDYCKFKNEINEVRQLISKSSSKNDVEYESDHSRHDLSAVQHNTNHKYGRATLSKADLISNIYENINSDWSSALCKKYNLDVSVIDKDTNIRFVSKTDQSVIDVKKHSVSANSKSENYSTVIEAMIEIYLKSVEGKNIFSHSVDSSDPVAKNLMEQMLANKLRKIGIIDNKINGKSIDQILTKNNDHPLSVEKEQTSSPSPKF